MADEKIIIHSIFTLAYILRSDFRFFLRDFDISPIEAKFLLMIFRGFHSVPELSQHFRKHKSTIAQKIHGLHEKALIKTVVSKHDRREKKLFLTEKGKKMAQEISLLHEQYLDNSFQDFSKKELSQLKSLLDKIKYYEK